MTEFTNIDTRTEYSFSDALIDKEFAKLIEGFIDAQTHPAPRADKKSGKTPLDEMPEDEMAPLILKEAAPEPSAFERLMSMVGLEEVKATITRQLSYHRLMKERGRRGFAVPRRLPHMMFIGNPGCGKTTVARLVARIYSDAGIIESDTFIETSRSQLVGRYIGDTEANTSAMIEDAKGGVLFIDEIYSLVEDTHSKRDFGTKVIDTLMPVLSDPDSNVMVIGAGYTDNIRAFMASNPGLTSRFPVVLSFPDFSLNELTQIAEKTLGEFGFEMTGECAKKLRQLISEASHTHDFGNARTVMTILDNHVLPNIATRVEGMDHDLRALSNLELSRVLPEDIPTIEQLFPLQAKQRSLGFKL